MIYIPQRAGAIYAARRRRRTPSGFAPPSVVGGWINLADVSGTTIPDRLQSGTNVTINGTGHTISANANGQLQMVMNGTDDWLAWALTAAMNSSQYIGIAMWIKLASTAGAQNICGHQGVGHVTRFFYRVEPGGFTRFYGAASVQNVNLPNHSTSWTWLSMAYDTGQTGDARFNEYRGTSLQSFTTTNVGGLDELPASLTTEVSLSGKSLGVFGDSAGSILCGATVGPNIFLNLYGQPSASENSALMNFQSMADAT